MRRARNEARYARNVRGQTGLTQAAFAARIGVPVETVRNWEQGKRSPRGPARALLKVIEEAPDAAFAVLGKGALTAHRPPPSQPAGIAAGNRRCCGRARRLGQNSVLPARRSLPAWIPLKLMARAFPFSASAR